MSGRVSPSTAPGWTDVVLLAMGLALFGGLGAGWLLSIPVRVGGAAGSLVASAALLGGMGWNPSRRSGADSTERE